MFASKVFNRLGLSAITQKNYESDKLVGLLDTSIGSLNVGDEIINDSAFNQLSNIFRDQQFIKVGTHIGITNVAINRINKCKNRFVCGSNIMNSKLFWSQQWNYSPLDFLRLSPLILLGVGWSNYQSSVSLYSKFVYKNILSKEFKHSVRDSYTHSKLKKIGIHNVLNTGCPTMWGLTKELCNTIPSEKQSNVVFTLTDYRKANELDRSLIYALKNNYDRVFFWVQGAGDYEYLKSLGCLDLVEIIPPKLSAYDEVLRSVDSIEFVGTRLHAGIRALQFGVRTLIIGVDNRALEKKVDFNLPVISREEQNELLLPNLLDGREAKISINENEILEWTGQFRD